MKATTGFPCRACGAPGSSEVAFEARKVELSPRDAFI